MNPKTTRGILLAVALLALAGGSSVMAEGRLERFERAVVAEDDDKPAPRQHAEESDADDEGCGFNFGCMLVELLFEIGLEVGSAVLDATVTTLVDDSSRALSLDAPQHAEPEPITVAPDYTPIALEESEAAPERGGFGRASLGYQRLDPDANLHALDLDLLAGYGHSVIRLRHTHFEETGAVDARLAYSRFDVGAGSYDDHGFNIGFGLGVSRLQGSQTHYGMETSLPIYWALGGGVQLHLDSAWSSVGADGVADYDTALAWRRGGVELRAGYRWLVGGGERLHGSYAALGLVW